MPSLKIKLSLSGFIILCFLLSGASIASEPVDTVVKGKFRDVKNNVKDAIRNKGIHISNVLHAGNMLNRTGPDFGYKDNIYEDAEIIEFCSGKISHELSRAGHLNIMLCPFKIAVYTLQGESDKVHIVYEVPEAYDNKAKPAIQQLEELLKSIIEEAGW